MACAVSLFCVPAASAATEVGSDCTADAAEKDLIVSELSRVGNPLPLDVPKAGVVTRWKIQVEEGREPLPQRLLILQSAGKGRGQMVLRESETELVGAGVSEFATRLPVREGDHLGLSGLTETFVCNTGTGLSRVFEGLAPAIGEIRDFEFREGIGMPVTAIVEPDRDGDGYGDEQQDKCPQSAAFHLQACSPVKLAVDAKARRRSILIHVRADMEVSVQVFGQVGWGFKSKRKSGDGHSKPTRLIVGLQGSTKDIAPGTAKAFRIALPKTVMRRLSRITPQESLKAQVTALATDSSGALAKRRVTVRLKGQEGA
jgi:hypothetical protein